MIGGLAVFRTRSFRRREEACSVPEMGLFLLTSFLPTLRHLRRWKPDVIHAHLAVPTGALAWAASWLTGIPYVLTAHLGDVPGAVPEQTDRLYRVLNPLIRPIWKGAAVDQRSERFCAADSRRRPMVCRSRRFSIQSISASPQRSEERAVGEPMHLVSVGPFQSAEKLSSF